MRLVLNLVTAAASIHATYRRPASCRALVNVEKGVRDKAIKAQRTDLVKVACADAGLDRNQNSLIALTANIFIGGTVVPNRKPGAVLSLDELESLRLVASGLGSKIPPGHRDTLVEMGLVRVEYAGDLAITDAGTWQLDRLDNELKKNPH
jgi:hypothetical protein